MENHTIMFLGRFYDYFYKLIHFPPHLPTKRSFPQIFCRQTFCLSHSCFPTEHVTKLKLQKLNITAPFSLSFFPHTEVLSTPLVLHSAKQFLHSLTHALRKMLMWPLVIKYVFWETVCCTYLLALGAPWDTCTLRLDHFGKDTGTRNQFHHILK
jgi:hypothetical protein